MPATAADMKDCMPPASIGYRARSLITTKTESPPVPKRKEHHSRSSTSLGPRLSGVVAKAPVTSARAVSMSPTPKWLTTTRKGVATTIFTADDDQRHAYEDRKLTSSDPFLSARPRA